MEDLENSANQPGSGRPPLITERGGTIYPGVKGGKANPGAGRPPGRLNTKTLLNKLLSVEMEVFDEHEGKKVYKSVHQQIVEAQILKAMEGDTTAFKEIHDRLDGKATQYMGSDPDHPLIPTSMAGLTAQEIRDALAASEATDEESDEE